jgi:hypothetical protein
MEQQTIIHPSVYEQTLIDIIRTLPAERVSQIIDFARFIQSQTIADDGYDLIEDETEEEIRASEERWDRLLGRPEAQRVMLEMAEEALTEEEAGLTVEMAFDDDGNLVDPR